MVDIRSPKASEEEIYSNFYDSIASKFTRSGYVNSLKNFMLFLKTDKYSELIRINIFDSIKSYIIFLKNRGISTRSITVKLYALKCFYEMNNIEDIKWKKLKRFKGEESDINEDRGYSHEEIQQILNVADLRTKAVILLLASSGIRVGALSSLKKSHLNTNRILVYAKSPQKYMTFITPECRSAIDNYLQFRERCGEQINAESPLFRSEFNINLPNIGVKPLGREGHHRHLYLVLIKCGLRVRDKGVHKRRQVMMIHGFRKFFKTQLVISKVDSELRELLLGHSLRSLEHIYTRLSEDEIYNEYSKAINLLTIDPANRLQIQVDELKDEKDIHISELKNKIKLLEDTVDNGIDFMKTQDKKLADFDRTLKRIVKVVKRDR